jgi:excisionase family DNA binding protein
MSKNLYSTFQAAKILGVSPDTVLKWIKTGKLPARRTLGGHYRIRSEIIDELLSENLSQTSIVKTIPTPKTFLHCWEFHSRHGKSIDACQECLVYKTRAKHCYEMNPVPKELGYMKIFCETECEDCSYYRHVKEQLLNEHPGTS